MNAVPCIIFPTEADLEKYKDTIPAYDEMIHIIRAEEEKGNVVVSIGDAGFMPQETYVVVDFAYEPRCEYDNLKVCTNIKNYPYKYLLLRPRKGDVSFAFGAWKYRMQDALADEIQRKLGERG